MINEFNFLDYKITLVNEYQDKTIFFIENDVNILDLINLINSKTNIKYNLVAISNINWNDDLSPWYMKSIFKNGNDFNGNANKLLNNVLKLCDYLRDNYNINFKSKALLGYSLAGLFSLYAAFNTNYFDTILCASGSLWFKDFKEYIFNHKINSSVKNIYLSLGDKEKESKNIYMSKIYDITNEIYNYINKQNIKTRFILNQGGHFNNVLERIADIIVLYLED